MNWTELHLEKLTEEEWKSFPFQLVPEALWFRMHGYRLMQLSARKRLSFPTKLQQCEDCKEWLTKNQWMRHLTTCQAEKKFGQKIPEAPKR